MGQEEKKEAKQRIFDAATALFARKGYSAVGTREIAKEANVNIAMINYYFSGKMGILKTIVNECFDKYYHALLDAADENTAPEERVRLIVRDLVDFFRTNTELATVAFNTLPIDVPEIMDIKVKWLSQYRMTVNQFFKQLGLDTDDSVQMGVLRGVLSAIIENHFQSLYAMEHVVEGTDKSEQTKEFLAEVSEPEYDDFFYEQYSEMLTKFYLRGVSGIIVDKKKE